MKGTVWQPKANFQRLLAKCGPFAWTLHNLVGHPVSEIVWLLSLGRAEHLSNWLHDVTVPLHERGKGRG